MSKTVIQIFQDGPYLVNGEIELKDADGRGVPLKKDVTALCRCGASCTSLSVTEPIKNPDFRLKLFNRREVL